MSDPRVFVECPMHGRQLAEYWPAPNWWKCPGAFQPGGGGCRTVPSDEDRDARDLGESKCMGDSSGAEVLTRQQ